MKPFAKDFQTLNTVTDYTRFYGMPAPAHPLLTVASLDGLRNLPRDEAIVRARTPVVQQLYIISLKRNLKGSVLRYGYQSYDFREGVLSFLSPGQGCWAGSEMDATELDELSGWMLIFHPDLLSKYPLGKKITGYGFFSYQVHEALHLSP